ncbi:hypothetical protein [Hymenobacter cellulosivorans]|uniref:DUF4377 domain-containing protein n=1 Tax=Hymenobacter cellulosivorans TaxID=2932249 RepID=A0ABY4FEC9_9BACT|nr:hypothetical protein [Hymenobacter cellulosivorans]UOQ54372.1 hypothetical protein MUN80_06330 [Hymenobacter cellulosivorans]
MRLTITQNWLVVSLAASLGLLSSCTEKSTIAPEAQCGTQATVRLCPGNTLICPTEHTTLELADGTRLRPSGSLWTAYLPKQVEGQVICIGYKLGAATQKYEVGNFYAEITCLQDASQCGTTAPANGGR